MVSLSLSCTSLFVFFQFPSNVLVLKLVFAFFQFHSVVSQDSKVYNSTSSFLFFFFFSSVRDNYYKVWSSGRNKVICLCFKIPEEFTRLIFQDGFLVVQIPFVTMVKFQLLAPFPVDHLAHLIVYSLILFLCCQEFSKMSKQFYFK